MRPIPAVPWDNPDNYNHQAARYADSLENAVWTNQFDNTANKQAHIETTGPEIWTQTGSLSVCLIGRVCVFFSWKDHLCLLKV